MNNKDRLKHYLENNKGLLILSFIFALIFVLSQLSQPFLLGKALDASEDNNKQLFNIYLIISLCLVFIGTIFSYLFENIVMNVSQKIIKNMRDDLYQKMNAISIKDIDQYSSGDLINLLIHDIENVSSGLFAVCKTLMQGIFTVIITIVTMLLVNWILGIMVILLTPLSMIMANIISKYSKKFYKTQVKSQSDLSSISSEVMENIDIVQGLNYEDEIMNKFNQQNDKLTKETQKSLFASSWVNPSTRLVNNIIYALVGIAGIIMLTNNNDLIKIGAVMSIGRLSSFLSYTNQYSKPFNEISNVAHEYQNAKASFNRINNFLSLDDDINSGQEVINNIQSIEFKNVNFSYQKDKELIKDFNLKINKGDKIAIVGPTGAGKTTLINLIMRFYDIDTGDILINDISIKNIDKSSFRKNIGMVLQDTWIFPGSIYDNIKYLKENSSEIDIKNAANKAHADVFINTLPQKYDTIINNKDSLSEGQKQMISIARVMLVNPDLIILDEATSNIDTRSEKLIINAFDNMMKEKTSIVIAHRLSTIINADHIIVMNNGHIIEVGNHHELMAKEGFYYQLYSSQYK